MEGRTEAAYRRPWRLAPMLQCHCMWIVEAPAHRSGRTNDLTCLLRGAGGKLPQQRLEPLPQFHCMWIAEAPAHRSGRTNDLTCLLRGAVGNLPHQRIEPLF